MIKWIISNKEWFLSGIGVTAIIMMFTLTKRIILTHKEKRKLRITYTFKQAWKQYILGQSPVFPLYSFEITNIGNTTIEIKAIQLNFCGKKIDTQWGLCDGLSQINTQNPTQYLGPLEPKKFIKGDFEISSFLPVINNQLKLTSNVRLKVVDTLGNSYYSKKTKFKNFLENVKISNEVNKNRGAK